MLHQKGLSLRRRKLIWLMAFFKCHKCQTVAPPSPKKFGQTGMQTVFLIKEV